MLANDSILIQLAVYLYDCENNWPNFCTIRDVYTNGKGNFYIRRVSSQNIVNLDKILELCSIPVNHIVFHKIFYNLLMLIGIPFV